MTPDETRAVMNDYFTAMGQGEFSQHFVDDVTWTTVETSEVAKGPQEVQDTIKRIHAGMSDQETTRLIFAEDAAYLEGSCAGPGEEHGRVGYCVGYDLAGGRIRAMRAYGSLGQYPAEAGERPG